jgi:hypothetical protein
MYFSLSPGHYARSWYDHEALTPEQITALGVEYQAMAEGPERENLLLRILKSFHNYIVKYADMIRRGHLPAYRSHLNKDSVVLLKYFIQGCGEPTRQNLQQVCRTLHFAFQGQSYDEIYNILAGMVLRAIASYDPEYTKKVRQIVAAIDRDIAVDQVFKAQQLGLPFDADKPLRWLAKRGILEAIKEVGVKDTRVIGFRVAAWPPKKSITDAQPIGLTYHIQRQFRFYLQGYISGQMRQTEAHTGGGLQLEHRGAYMSHTLDQSAGICSHNGRNLTGHSKIGRRYGAEITDGQLDVGLMDWKWVAKSSDPLFSGLSILERRILYFHYAREMSWKQIARTCRKGVKTIQRIHQETIDKLQYEADVPVAA